MKRIALLCLALVVVFGTTTATAASTTRVVRYDGASLRVPASWRVYHVSAGSRTCVRFDRHAVYLGVPGSAQACPITVLGRSEAILVQPLASARPVPSGTDSANVARGKVLVTATWNRDPQVIRAALGVRTLHGLSRAPKLASTAAPGRGPRVRPALSGRQLGPPATPGAAFQGQGFDACTTPSTSQMSAWTGSSPYQAVGVYIGGPNLGCARPNLNSSWVQTESAEGWHLVPIYVGLQAPKACSGCATIDPTQAAAQGSAAAADAVTDARSLGLGPGNPIYLDVENYTRNSANTAEVLAYIQGWDQWLGANGYVSGVYVSESSGAADLVSQYGTAYTEPADLWFAAWPGSGQTTSDPVIPATDWPGAQRLHQYSGNTTGTYSGTTLSIDKDYLDGSTAAYGSGTGAPAPSAPPATSAAPTITGTPVVHQVLTAQQPAWTNSPSSYAYQWYSCTALGGNCSPISGATGPTLKIPAADADMAIEVGESAANIVGSSPQVMSAPTAPVSSSIIGYYGFSATGAVFNSVYEPNHGSAQHVAGITGMAVAPGNSGYWLVGRGGTVLTYGSAPRHPRIRVRHSVIGIVPTPHGGYWLYTAEGNVYPSAGSGSFGSPVISGLRLKDIVGMAATPDGKGYWLATRVGTVLPYGDARNYPHIKPAHPIKGIVATPHGGYWLYTAQGNVYAPRGTSVFHGPAASHVVGMVATPHGKGYWLITRGGAVYGYGAAPSYPPLGVSGTLAGAAG